MNIGPSSVDDRRLVPAREPLRLAGWAVLGVCGAALIAFPLIELAREVIGAGWTSIRSSIGEARGPIVNTVWTAAVATCLTLTGATAIALVAAASPRSTRRWIVGGMVVPLLVPPFVSALSWVAAFGPGGLLDDVIGVSAGWIFGPAGVVVLLVVSAMPIAFLIVLAALDSRQERDLVRAARLAGAAPFTAFRTITLPLLRPALIGAGAITFITSANAFGIPAVLGTPARFGTATTRLYRDLVLSADQAAFDRVLVLAAALAVITLVVVGGADRIRRVPPRLRVEASGPRSSGGTGAPARAAVGGFVVVTALLPLLALVLTALTRAVGLSSVPANWTLENFGEAFAAGAGSALWTSVKLGLLASSVIVALGGLLVALERRRRSGLGTAAALSFAVPGSVLAVSVLLAYGPWLRDTLLLILVAYAAKFWALGHRPMAAAADAISPELFGAARVSGARRAVATRTITIPLLRPSIVAAFLIVLMFSLHELTMSSLLYGPGSETLAVTVLELQQLGDATVTAALATVLTLGSALVVVPMLWVMRARAVRRAW